MIQTVATGKRSPDDSRLSKSVTVAQYQQFEKNKQKAKIAAFIRERFTERYILPMKGRNKHGFAMMAIACLMIETLESFREGWPNTEESVCYKDKPMSKGKLAFYHFFQRDPLFKEFDAGDFYKGVRCGILHQAETANGWHIMRKGPLFEPATKTINATRFLGRVERNLDQYCEELKLLDWDSVEWKNLQKKMNQVCKNCEQKQQTKTNSRNS